MIRIYNKKGRIYIIKNTKNLTKIGRIFTNKLNEHKNI